MSPFNVGAAEGPGDARRARAPADRERAKVADALAKHPKISKLIYPGRADHPQAATIKQMRAGSSLVAFEVKGERAAAFRVLNGLKARISNSLGDAKSLVTHPTTPSARAELTEGMIRFSAGWSTRTT